VDAQTNMDGKPKDATSADAQLVDSALTGPDANPGCTTRLGAVAWWRGETNAEDSAGNHDGEAMTGVSYAAGKVGVAFQFNGSSRISVADPSETFRFAGPFSVEMWVKRPASAGNPGSPQVFVGKNQCVTLGCLSTPGSRWLLGLSASTTYPRFFINPNSNGNGLAAVREVLIPEQSFHHVVATYSGSAMSIYVDGNKTLVKSVVASSFANAETELPFYIGGSATGEGFEGWIDEVVYYDRALTDAEVAMLHLNDCI